MSGRKRRDRPRTMDELLHQAQASMPSGEPRSTPDAAQSSSMAPPSATSTGPSASRGRGPARGIRSWNSGHPIDVEFDETYHPMGTHARQLISQLGHTVRDPYAFPLTTLDWEAFPVETLDRICEEVQREAVTNTRNRAMQGPAHRLGTRHITQVRHELRSEGAPVDRMSVWMRARDPRHPEVAAIFYQSRLEELLEEERSLPSRRDEIFHSVVGREGHGYTLTYGTGIPRSHITRLESSGASSSQGLRLHTDEEVEQVAARSLQNHDPLLRHLTLAAATRPVMTRLERAVMIQQARLIVTRCESIGSITAPCTDILFFFFVIFLAGIVMDM
ncbi:hypothetical protein CKAN_02001200 [Cinnamomum micranthum f. kanehirae]|uniref:Uncharacterized protein n=1 Tax=Cinnamomum micranthum f. kanehirae TaxID=337451 RepID=A0A3S3P166_9MAGN|nr:hypothetical protein CKAN_02001200 [Cinnamomum micranthum f. kanehirae]